MTNVFTQEGNLISVPSPRMPYLYDRCARIHQDIVKLSAMTEDQLADACVELQEYVNVWHSDHKDFDPNDPFVAFRRMLDDWAIPWPASENSELNGLTLAQFYVARAYGYCETALAGLTQRPKRGSFDKPCFDEDDAACFALYAAQGLAHAKMLLELSKDRIAQKGHRRSGSGINGPIAIMSMV